jgi:hypothetical protein
MSIVEISVHRYITGANRFELVRWYVATAGLPPPSQNFHQPAMSPATLLSAKRCAKPPPGLTFDK